MSIFMGMNLYLDVVSASESIYVGPHDGILTTVKKLDVILRADVESQICLPSGQGIHTVDIPFTLSTSWKTGEDIKTLPPEDNAIGFLFHATQSDGTPFVHGAAIWPMESFPDMSDAARWRVVFGLSNLETMPEYAPPFQWETGRNHMLLIEFMELRSHRLQQSQD